MPPGVWLTPNVSTAADALPDDIDVLCAALLAERDESTGPGTGDADH